MMPSPGGPAIWGGVPQRNKNFTGRTELLTRLREAADRATALQGLGGVGKSATVTEYAHQFRHDFDLIWWVPADHPALTRASLANLAGPLGLTAAASAGIEAAAAAALDALRRGNPTRRWLLVFDNADQPEEVNQILPRGPGQTLITTRNHRWNAVVDTVPVDVFARNESIEFLTRRAPKALTAVPDADNLADKLGDLPLALEQAGALLAETGLSAPEYVTLLDENVTQLLAEGHTPDYPMSMTAAWHLSVAKLRQFLPQAVTLLRCCAFFGPDPIPRDVFRRGAQARTLTDLGDLLANPILLASAIRELGRFALVTIDGRRLVIHRLIQALIRDSLDPSTRAAFRYDVHAVIATGTPADPADLRQWPAYAELVAHVGSAVTDLAGCKVPGHRRAALSVLRYLYLSGDLASCQAFAKRFISGWSAGTGSVDDVQVLDAKRHLGNTLRQLGQYQQAYAINSATFEVAGRTLGPRDRLTLGLRTSLGADQRALGDFAEALRIDQDAVAQHSAVFGPDDPQTLRVKSNLALDYVLTTDYHQARELHQQVFLLQSESTAGVSASEILSSWNSLAWDVRLCGEYSAARDVSEDAWDYGRERLGAEHYQTLRTTNALAIALRMLGGPAALTQALELTQQVVAQCRRLYGDGHPDTLAAAINLASVLRVSGSLAEAISLAEATVARYPSAYGPDHPYAFGSIGNLAVLRRLSGEFKTARSLNETALAGLDRRLSRDHHYSLTVAANLASDLAVLGRTVEAASLGSDTAIRLRMLLGEEHPVTLGCAANLSLDTADDRLAADALLRLTRSLGPAHPDVQQAAAGQRLSFDFDPPAI